VVSSDRTKVCDGLRYPGTLSIGPRALWPHHIRIIAHTYFLSVKLHYGRVPGTVGVGLPVESCLFDKSFTSSVGGMVADFLLFWKTAYLTTPLTRVKFDCINKKYT